MEEEEFARDKFPMGGKIKRELFNGNDSSKSRTGPCL